MEELYLRTGVTNGCHKRVSQTGVTNPYGHAEVLQIYF
jgi:hypothetical protein